MMRVYLMILTLTSLICAEVLTTLDPLQKTLTIQNKTTQIQEVIGLRCLAPSTLDLRSEYMQTYSVIGPNNQLQEAVVDDYWNQSNISPNPNQTKLLNFGLTSMPTLVEPLYKYGTCNTIPTQSSALALTPQELIKVTNLNSYYQITAPYVDLLGSNGGKYAGGLMDHYMGQTQFLLTLPSTSFQLNGTTAQFTTKFFKTPLTLMSLAMIQEFFGVDHQFLLANWAKETGFMLSTNQGTEDWYSQNWTNTDSVFGPGEVQSLTYITRALAYPKFFPYDTCLMNSGDVWAARSKCNLTEISFAEKYFGKYQTHPDSAHIVNATIASALVHLLNYDLLNLANTLGFKEALTFSKDRNLGICAVLPLYNMGLFSGAEAPLKGSSTKDWSALNCSSFPPGYSNYTPDIISVAQVLENASQNQSYFEERWITLDDVRHFYFGDNSSALTPYRMDGNQQNGGLLKHFELGLNERQSLWQDLVAAFDLLSGHWALQNGQKVISLRYDWLSHLRIAKRYLDLDRGLPRSTEAKMWIDQRTTKLDWRGVPSDTHWPFAQIQSAGLNSANQYEVSIGAQELNVDDRGVAKIEWTHKRDWTLFNQTGVQLKSQAGLNTTWQIQIPRNLVQKDSTLYFRVTDSCGNAIVVEHLVTDPVLPVRPSVPKFGYSMWSLVLGSDLTKLEQDLMDQKLKLEMRNLKGQLIWWYNKQPMQKIIWPKLGSDPVYLKLNQVN